MLDYAIVFALGFLIAGLLSFAMLPIVWGRALRLTRRQLEAMIPLSMEEVRARQDAIRAEAAIETQRLEARIDAERDRRHAAMAEEGRLSAEVARLRAELGSRDEALGRFAEGQELAQASVAEAQQAIAGLKAEVAAAKVNLTLRDKMVEDGKRALDQLIMENDGLRVEIVAMRTKLGTAEDELAQARREIEELTAAGIERDGRLAVQGQELAGRIGAVTMLESQLVTLEKRLAAAQAEVFAAHAARSKLEAEREAGEVAMSSARAADLDRLEVSLGELAAERERAAAREQALIGDIARLTRELDAARQATEVALSSVKSADLDRREAALAEHAAELERAEAREHELRSEIHRLRAEAQRSMGELANGVAALRSDRQAILDQLEEAKAERSRLQSEVGALKREARESWLAIEADNQQLRVAMARIAAEIARQATQRVSHAPSALPPSEAPKLEAPKLGATRLSLPDPAA